MEIVAPLPLTGRTRLADLLAMHPRADGLLREHGLEPGLEDPNTPLELLCRRHRINYWSLKATLLRDPPTQDRDAED
jgi:hypothetical protein